MSATINVAFSDSKETTVVAWMLTPQPESTFPNQGEIQTSDSRYATFFNANPMAQQMMPTPTTN
jgi:hypothetical protein